MTDDTWGRIRKELLNSVGRNNYKNWIEPLEFSGLRNGVATFLVPTSFMGKWVSRNFGDQILHQLSKAGEEVSRVEFSVPHVQKPKAVKAADAAAPEPAAAKIAATAGDLPGAALDRALHL